MDARYKIGQWVELYPTIPAEGGGSLVGGTRGQVRGVRKAEDRFEYLVAFEHGERHAGSDWLPEDWLFEA